MVSLSHLLEQRRRWRERKNHLTRKLNATKARIKWSLDPFARADAERAATDIELGLSRCLSRIRVYDARIDAHPGLASFLPRKLNREPSRGYRKGVK